jgi:NAD(P)-dependent dehydrogenase (short-subunit alcohol dehydrogenase family)
MPKVALVTGGNQGLGFTMVAGLCRKLPTGATVYLGARDAARGAAAVAELAAAGSAPALLPIDVADDASVVAAAAQVAARHGGIDIVISNAAARMVRDRPMAAQVDTFVNTNNHGTYRMIRAFAPHLRDGGRFLVVASSFGSLRNLAPHLHDRFDVTRRSLEEIEAAMDAYADSVKAGRDKAEGWPDWMNIPSKIAQVASVKVLARMRRDDDRRRGILIDAVCPGLIDTAASRPWFDDMSKAQTPDQAAVDPVWLATDADAATAPYGELVRFRKVVPWT